VKPEDIERFLIEDGLGVAASPTLNAAVMAAVQREAGARPPIPFPWARAWPGIAAVVLALVGSWLAVPNLDASTGIDAMVAVSDWAQRTSASFDPAWFAIALAVVALTVVPVAAPFWVVSAVPDS
jgi:hypothetical protein